MTEFRYSQVRSRRKQAWEMRYLLRDFMNKNSGRNFIQRNTKNILDCL